MAFYVRRLPHWHPPESQFFLTWRLYGSLPKAAHGPTPLKKDLPAGAEFFALDEQLDFATSGPVWMKDPQVAESVSRVLLAGMFEWKFYELDAWVVMANHVHLLVRPLVPFSKAIMNIKSASARAANAAMGRMGKHFWQDESLDHWVRSTRERDAIVRYIEYNPVAAGLVDEVGEWCWSSAGWPRMAPPHRVAANIER